MLNHLPMNLNNALEEESLDKELELKSSFPRNLM